MARGLSTGTRTERNTAISVIAGVLYLVAAAGATQVSADGFRDVVLTSEGMLMIAWVAGGLVVLGAAAAGFLLQQRLVTPALFIVGLFVYALRPGLGSTEGLPALLAAYFFAWPIVLILAIDVGGIVLALRRGFVHFTTVVLSEDGGRHGRQ